MWRLQHSAQGTSAVEPEAHRGAAGRFDAVHTLQRTAGNRVVARLLVAQREGAGGKDAGAGAVKAGPMVFVYVRDPGLNLGGGAYADDLEAVRNLLMGMKNSDQWTLVLAIHGSQDRVGAQIPGSPDPAKDKFYNSGAVQAVFSDAAFVKWRDQFGPTRLVLTACQVGASFETAMATAIARPGSPVTGQGLGTGCKPMTSGQSVAVTSDIKTRADFNKLKPEDKQVILTMLKELNQKWGYFGAPPVPEDKVLDYYLDVQPLGEWAIVEVGKVPAGGHDPQGTGIPYWNRSTGPDRLKFFQLCNQGFGGGPAAP